MIKPFVFRAVALMLTTGLAACSNEGSDATTTSATPTPTPTEKAWRWDIMDVPLEDFNDKALWKTPRLEFLVDLGVNDFITFTSDLNGKNIRRVYTKKEITESGKYYSVGKHRRSPNNRYIVDHFNKKDRSAPERSHAGIFDLHTRKHIVAGHFSLGGADAFAWSPNSDYIIWRGREGITKFDIATGKRTVTPNKEVKDFFVLPDENIVAIRWPGFVFYDKNMNELLEVPVHMLGTNIISTNAVFSISPSKRYILANGSETCVFDLTIKENNKELFCNTDGKMRYRYATFYDDNHIVSRVMDGLLKYNFITGESEEIPIERKSGVRMLYAVINTGVESYPTPNYPYKKDQ